MKGKGCNKTGDAVVLVAIWLPWFGGPSRGINFGSDSFSTTFPSLGGCGGGRVGSCSRHRGIHVSQVRQWRGRMLKWSHRLIAISSVTETNHCLAHLSTVCHTCTTTVPVPVRLLGAGILMVIMGMRVLMWTRSQFIFTITGKLLFHCTSSGRCGVGTRNSMVFLTRIHGLGWLEGLGSWCNFDRQYHCRWEVGMGNG